MEKLIRTKATDVTDSATSTRIRAILWAILCPARPGPRNYKGTLSTVSGESRADNLILYACEYSQEGQRIIHVSQNAHIKYLCIGMHRSNLYLKRHYSLSTNSKHLQAIPFGAIVTSAVSDRKQNEASIKYNAKFPRKKSNILGWKYISLISVL